MRHERTKEPNSTKIWTETTGNYGDVSGADTRWRTGDARQSVAVGLRGRVLGTLTGVREDDRPLGKS